jgi:hypothetical protein
MIAIAVMMFVVFIAVVAGALAITRWATLDYEKTRVRLHEPSPDTLVYEVPRGRDPVELTSALAQAGFTAVEDIVEGSRHVLVECPHERPEDRSLVRSIIEDVYYPSAGAVPGAGAIAVRFADEG